MSADFRSLCADFEQTYQAKISALFLHNGTTAHAYGEDRTLLSASLGKVLVAAYVAHAGVERPSLLTEMLHVGAVPRVEDSGILQRLALKEIAVQDAVALMCSSSDNWCTNLLIERLGLIEIQHFTRQCGIHNSAQLDYIRDVREKHHPIAPSQSAAFELAQLMHHIANGSFFSEAVSARLRDWLSLNADTTLVADALSVDPLSHSQYLFNKTGWDVGVRADAGSLISDGGHMSYAVIVNFEASHEADFQVRTLMRQLGELALSS
jgi:beta-lactamase class A